MLNYWNSFNYRGETLIREDIITQHSEYHYPSQPEAAVNMIWGEVAQNKISSVQFNLHRKNREFVGGVSK